MLKQGIVDVVDIADVAAARWKHMHTAVVDAKRIREQADDTAARRIETHEDIPDSRRTLWIEDG